MICADISKSEEVKEPLNWTNQLNQAFYNAMTPVDLKKIAETGGIHLCCDLKQILPEINQCKTILEVGAGYGRAIDFLLANHFKGKISGIENGMLLCKFLKIKYKNDKLIDIIRGDVRRYQFSSSFDMVILLWSGICDYSPLQQTQLLYKLSKLLTPSSGRLVLDILSEDYNPLNTIAFNKQEFITKYKKQKIYSYLTSEQEIREFVAKIGLTICNVIYYKIPEFDRKRVIYIISN